MSGVGGAGRPPGREGVGDHPVFPTAHPRPASSVGCHRDHRQGRGSLDETARRLTHEELAVALLLSAEGHQVRALATRRGQGRTADLLVCGAPVEVKSWDEGRGLPPGPRSVVNKLKQAEGQAATVVLNGRGRGLSEAAARAGLEAYAGLARPGRVAGVRVLGDGFELGWTRPRTVRRDPPIGPPGWARGDRGVGL